MSTPVQNVASAARYRHVNPTSSGCPTRPRTCKYEETLLCLHIIKMNIDVDDLIGLCFQIPVPKY
jgi:hypothetical protein